MSRTRWALSAVGLFGLEVLIATVWRHVPFVRADLGDYLVVVLVYAAAKAVGPYRATPLALAVFALGVVVEVAQALGLADRLGLAEGGVLRILVGTSFQLTDLAMYAAGCATAWLIDAPGRSVVTSPRAA